MFKLTLYLPGFRLWIPLAGVLVLSVLSGCSQDLPVAPGVDATGAPALSTQITVVPARQPTPTPPKTEPVTQIEVDAPDLNGLEILFWHSFDGSARAMLDKLVEEFNRSNEWGVQVRAEYQGNYDQLDQQVRLALETEQPPHLVAAYLYQALQWDSDPSLAALGKYIDDPIWGLSEEQQADFYPSIWQAEVIAGERLGIPALRSGQYLYYNQTWGGELGFSRAPQNWPQLEQQVCAAAQAASNDDEQENDGLGGLLVTTDHAATLGWLAAFGSRIVDAESGAYQLDTPAVQDAFEALRKLSERGCAWLVENGSAVENFSSRHGLIASGSLLEAPFVDQAMQRAGRGDQWTVLPFLGIESSIIHYGPAYVVLTSSPEEELAAWLFIRWLLTPASQEQWLEASGGLPLQRSVSEQMQDYATRNPHWAAAVALLPDSQAEPSLASWHTVRWAFSDATVQLFRYYFTLDQVPDLVKLLDETVHELSER